MSGSGTRPRRAASGVSRRGSSLSTMPRMFFAMEWLDPADHRLWKTELAAGPRRSRHSRRGRAKLAAIHAATAGDAAIAALFPTGRALRGASPRPLSARHGARAIPTSPAALNALADRTAATTTALVHGDVSPKNIMVGPARLPVFLDAECAWYGDPAFDLAFCLNHLLLKCLRGRRQPRLPIPRRLRPAGWRLSRRRRLGAAGRARGPRRVAAPGLVSRPGRRQVAGRVCDRRSGQGASACAVSPFP